MGISTIERSLVCIHIAIPNYTADSNTVISIIRCRMWMPLLALTALAMMPAVYGQGEVCEQMDLVFVIDSSGSIRATYMASREELEAKLTGPQWVWLKTNN